MQATHEATIPLSTSLSTDAQTGHILDNLKTGSLISIGQLCDDDCIALFGKYNLKIFKDGQIIVRGTRNPSNGLWNIPLHSLPPTKPTQLDTHLACSAIRNEATQQDLAGFYHGTAFSPIPSTFLRAIKKGHFATWPGLTPSLITKHLLKSMATSKGHMRLQQKHINSTKTTIEEDVPDAVSLDMDPIQEPQNARTHEVHAALICIDNKEFARSYSDQTGKFPVQSTRGNNYIFILYDYDSNAILSTPLSSRQASKITTAWTTCHNLLKSNGYEPVLHILDNECSNSLKDAFKKHSIAFQRVPPHTHRRNAAERAIQTWKNHFISGLASCDPNFPLAEWDRLLPQCDITLNHLRSSRRQPKLSAHACISGIFDFNATPMAVPGTKVLTFEAPSQRRTFAPHGREGYYIGPSLEHYRCYKTFLTDTNAIRDTLTLDWFPKTVPFPKVTNDNYLRQTADDLLSLLQPAQPATQAHSLTYGSNVTNAYIQIAQLLRRATTPPTPRPTADPPRVPTPAPATLPTNPATIPRVATPAPPAPAAPPQAPSPRPANNNVPIRPTQAIQHPLPPDRQPRVPIITKQHPTAQTQFQFFPTQNSAPQAYYKLPQAYYPPMAQFAPKTRRTYQPLRPLHPNLLRPYSDTASRYSQATQYLAQAAISNQYAHHIAALSAAPIAGKQESLQKLLKGPEKERWNRGNANEFGRLLPHGIGKNRPDNEKIKGTGTIFPIRRHAIPSDRKVTYANFVCNIRPQKAETHRVRMTAGGDKLDYPGDPSSPAVAILDAKLHINSVISDAKHGARYLTLDIKNFYLGTPMKYFQYIRVKREVIPQEVMDEYNFTIEPDGHAYFEIRRGMYGLKEAGIIAFQQLVQKLRPYGYEPMKHTPGFWRHTTRKTTFTLCVDDFGVKYFNEEDAHHLINAVKDHYEVTTDWAGKLYIGMNLDWQYEKGYVDASMDGYARRALTKFDHKPPSRPQHAPHPYNAPIYGSKQPQKATVEAKATPLDAEGKRRIQAIAGTFLYYSEIDPCIKPALNEISSAQANPTEDTNTKAAMLMDYLHTYPDAVLRFHASDMILTMETDAAYLVLPQARSRAAAWFILGNDPNTHKQPMTNAPVHVMCNTIKNVMASAAEAETGGIFMATQRACPLRTAIIELGHPQPKTGTPCYTDNATAKGILTASMRQKLSKAFDMRFYWIRDRIQQGQFDLIWRKGILNMADYFTKHHPAWHHRNMRYKYLQRANCAYSAYCTDNPSACKGVLLPRTLLPYLQKYFNTLTSQLTLAFLR